MRSRVLALLLPAVGLATVLLAGCSSDDPPSGAASASASPDDATSADGTAAGQSTPSDAVEPASGRRVDVGDATFRLPDEPDWITTPSGDLSSSADGRRIFFGRSYSEPDLDYAADLAIDSTSWRGPSKPVAQPTRVVDGVEGYVVEAVDREGFFYEFGIVEPGTERNLFFTFVLPDDGQDHRDLVDAVLATVRWK